MGDERTVDGHEAQVVHLRLSEQKTVEWVFGGRFLCEVA